MNMQELISQIAADQKISKAKTRRVLGSLINQINNIPQEILYLCVIIDITGIHVDTPEPEKPEEKPENGSETLLDVIKSLIAKIIDFLGSWKRSKR